MTTAAPSPFGPSHEERLEAFDLSTPIIHDGIRPGGSRAANRSSLALKSAPGTDIYQDGMENFHKLLRTAGWKLVYVDGQPRLLHPEGKVAFAISSAKNVGHQNLRMPRTRRKGNATRNALAGSPQHESLFDLEGIDAPGSSAELVAAAQAAPLYFLLCERSERGDGLALEFSRPAEMTQGGRVNNWTDRIQVGFLELEGDLSVFDDPDGGYDEFDVPVEPR
jgi:hypothetical protein